MKDDEEAAMHRFRFGVMLESIRDGRELTETVRRAEAAGYDTVLIRDHFVSEPFGPQLAPFAALATAAATSSTIRIGTLVIDNDFRHPANLAKEAATLDLLSGGRFELGLGAGWLAAEYEQAGISFDAAGTRIARLEESIGILRRLFGGEPVSFQGQHYQIDGLSSFPLPAQQPHPPILLGGGGRKMLSLAGREADIISLLTTSVASGTLEVGASDRLSDRVSEKIGWIKDAAGERFNAIELSLFPDFVVAEDRLATASKLATERGWDVSPQTVLDMPAVFIGSVEQIVATLQERRERFGFSYFVISDAELDLAAPLVQRLART
jgi:probable F420-dependent oxidoreductase